MDRVEQYRRNVEEAERSAAQAQTPEERQSYERIAAGWRELILAEELTRARGV